MRSMPSIETPMNDQIDTPSKIGLVSQRNWLAAMRGDPQSGVSEYPLYSDAHITGEFVTGLGPYCFLNTVPLPSSVGTVNAPIIVRVSEHIRHIEPDMSRKNEELYHGGWYVDEIASLTSLCLGARIRAGGETRRFDPGKDPLGRPQAWNDGPRPTLHVRHNRIVLPSVVGTHSLDQLAPLATIPQLTTTQFVSLIRACNLYQDALWTAESEPNLAWLMLVSAIETAANEFNASRGSAVERLGESKPDLAKLLESAGGNELLTKVATMIEPSLGATKKFIDFTLRFVPCEPPKRPTTEWLRVDWSAPSMKKNVLNKVYSYRSRSLHGGIPFPAPMFEPPFRLGEDPCPSEKPLTGLASHSRGATWLPDDIPINLHCFHYITRGCLLNWWRSMAEAAVKSVNPSDGSGNC